ncbi:asparagine synthase (glutamine-hydrolyzing) [Dokdonella sp.]|uniref:asparagine synthase (glutamine-hydrolyzing) n=1 Tax=Dokdonella sp. TaxID=2291710 RepID=UPI0031BE5825|nr:asparagine synthase (glutamine-hydrolyzing) [Dokdonella sp.]
MCGIAGYVVAPGAAPPDVRDAHAMNQVIRHRGPDDEGVFCDARALLGMRRLAIIDLASGHQPLTSSDGQVHVVFNGEIYNFRELREELAGLGHSFRTRSEAEVIVEAYIAWGEGCFAHLHGMFAIALWDARRQVLLLARDRFGEKPLYVAEQASRLLFASELKSLLQVPGFAAGLDREALRGYVAFGYVPSPRSILAGVRKLAPGHYLRYADGKASIQRYYQLRFEPKTRASEAQAGEELAHLLEQAVSSRLVSDVPFGAFLSGGLDSSVVVALMSRHLTQPVKTFSIGFREAEFNELDDARRVANLLGTEHHELMVDPDAVALLHTLVWHLDEPFADASALPTYLVAQLASSHVKMALSGDAGDETFAGYTRYLRYLRLHQLGALKPLAAAVATLGGHLLGGSNRRRLLRIAESLRLPFPDNYLSVVALTRVERAQALLGERGSHYETLAAAWAQDLPRDPLDRIVAIDFASYLADDILVKVDRMSMANSLESRAPLLDHRLVEFAASLPANLRIRGGRGKYLLRQVAARWLPPDVLEKRKQGFGLPLARWFRGPLRELASDLLASRAFRERGLIDPHAAEQCLQQHLSGADDCSEALWLILSLELWARRFLDEGARENPP